MDLSINDLVQLINHNNNNLNINNKMLREYVIVRCRDAGVHCGYLESYQGRECVLTSARRLWYWKPADKAAFLSGLASAGAGKESKISRVVSRIHLTENCEIISCSDQAKESLIGAPNYNE